MISGLASVAHLRLLAPLLLLVGLCFARPAGAQGARLDNPDRGQIRGQVVDAESLSPLPGVVVQLSRAGAAAAPPLRSVVTDSTGGYRFERLPAGRYHLFVERIGYLARTVEIDLVDGDQSVVGFGLEFRPVLLPPIEVSGRAPQPFLRDGWSEPQVAAARVEVARMRQDRFLAGDVRVLTRADLVESVTLGESDLFRALQRTPGVSTRDDYTATLWTRGATWDQTRVFLDGMPLYNPTHAGWLFTAVNPDALGDVSFFPGYRSVRWGEGTAAVLDLRTREGGTKEGISGLGELSAASARLALDGEVGSGGIRWMIAGRRTYVDLLTRLVETVAGRDDLAVPYDFSDLIGRVDIDLGRGWSVQASGIAEWDELRGDVAGLLRGNTGSWGNVAGRGSLLVPVAGVRLPLLGRTGPMHAQLTYGVTRFGTTIHADSTASARATLPSLENEIAHEALRIQLRPADGDRRRWGWGVEGVRDRVRYDGPLSLLGVLGSIGDLRDGFLESRFTRDEPLRYAALWAERRIPLLPGLTLEPGLRLEAGDSVANGGRLRWAPRVAASYEASSSTRLSASWSRSFQYTQDVAPAAGPIGPQLHLSAVWVVASAGQGFPAARAEIATAGFEHWLAQRWLIGGTVFRRTATGLQVPNPDTGAVFAGRNPNALATNVASGLDLSLQRLTGRLTGTASYSVGRSRMVSAPVSEDGASYAFPSSADIRHAVDATTAVELGRGWRGVGALTVGSGVPFTRVILPDTAGSQGGAAEQAVRITAPNGERTPPYASVDLGVDYTRRVGGWQVNLYAQLKNVFDRDNRLTYLGSRQCGSPADVRALAASVPECTGAAAGGVEDSFESGLPRLPLIGIRVAF